MFLPLSLDGGRGTPLISQERPLNVQRRERSGVGLSDGFPKDPGLFYSRSATPPPASVPQLHYHDQTTIFTHHNEEMRKKGEVR